MRISGKTILVVGATSGIGQALAEALHDRGNTVIAAGRRQARLDAMIGARPAMLGALVDITQEASVEALRRRLGADLPMPEVLIANAGIARAEDYLQGAIGMADAEAIVATNILGVIRLVTALLPGLRARAEATVLVTSSNLAFLPLAAMPTYCASKAFIHSWLQSLRHQLRDSSVEVLELAPPYVRTELTGSAQLDDPYAMPLAAFVEEVLGLLSAGSHPRGEVMVAQGSELRGAEREGRYDALYAAMNAPR